MPARRRRRLQRREQRRRPGHPLHPFRAVRRPVASPLDLLSAFLARTSCGPDSYGLALVAATLGFVQVKRGYIPNWVQWNYEGIQRKSPYGVLQQLMAA
jgi:hypothetical protein